MLSSPDNRSSASFFERTLDRVQNGVVVYRPICGQAGDIVDFQCVYANAKAALWMGLPVTNLPGKTLSELYPRVQPLLTYYSQVVQTGEAIRFDFDCLPIPDQPRLWFDLQVEAFDEGIVVSFSDISDRKRTEEELRQERRRMAEAQTLGHVGSFEWTVGDSLTYWSDELFRIAGLEPNASPVTLDMPNRLVHPDDWPTVRALEERSVREPGRYELVHRLLRGTGEVRWVHHQFESLTNKQGLVQRVIGTLQDITDYYQATQELKRSNTLLQGVLNSTLNAIAVYEVKRDEARHVIDFMIKLMNEAALQQLSFPPEQAIGKSLLDVSPHSKELGLFNAAVEVAETGVSQTVTREFDSPNKSFQTGISRFGDDIILSSVDVSLVRQYQQEAEQQAQHLQAVLNGSPASIAFLKASNGTNGEPIDFVLVVCNQRFADLCEHPAADLVGQSYRHLEPLLWQDKTFAVLKSIFTNKTPHYEERPLPATDRWLGLVMSRQDDGVLLTALDITDLKRMQKRQEELIDQVRRSGQTVEQLTKLQEQVRSRGALLRASSHDLRGSLGVIQGAAGLLAFADTDEEREQMLDILQRNVQTVTQMITDLLDYARLEAGEEQMHVQPLDGSKLLMQVCQHVEPLISQKGLTLHTDGPTTLLVQGDALNITRIVQNLVLNALKYTSAGSISLYWSEKSPDQWSFSVRDTGPGMPDELIQRLSRNSATKPTTDAPSQPAADQLMPASAPGEGIGLHIVQQLCDLLGGRLIVESSPDGSTFHVTLPRLYPILDQ